MFHCCWSAFTHYLVLTSRKHKLIKNREVSVEKGRLGGRHMVALQSGTVEWRNINKIKVKLIKVITEGGRMAKVARVKQERLDKQSKYIYIKNKAIKPKI